MKLRYLLPLLFFLALAALLALGLGHERGDLPSPLVGRVLPDFRLARVDRVDETGGDFSPD